MAGRASSSGFVEAAIEEGFATRWWRDGRYLSRMQMGVCAASRGSHLHQVRVRVR